jgi:hypothetical protein
MNALRSNRLAVFSLSGSLLSLLASTFLPIWTVWYLNWFEGVGYHRSLWGVAADILRSNEEVECTGDLRDLVTAALAAAAGAAAGLVVGLARKDRRHG